MHHQDERFLPEIDKRTGYVTQSILCLPILSRQGNKVLGVAEMVNKKGVGSGFTQSDEQVHHSFVIYLTKTKINNGRKYKNIMRLA